MTGWHNQVGETFVEPKGCIGLVIAQKFPEPDLIRTRIIEGVSRVHPDTVWVMRDTERKGHAACIAYETFREMDIEPALAPLVPYWQSKGLVVQGPLAEEERSREHLYSYDFRARMRDAEIRQTCERVIVFHDSSSGVTADWIEYKDGGTDVCAAKVYVVERGKKKKPARKGRKPQGV